MIPAPIQIIKVAFNDASIEAPYCADFTELPGSPLVGYGITEAEAIGDLVSKHPWWFTIVRE